MWPFNWISKSENPQYGVYIGDLCIASGFGSKTAAYAWINMNGQEGVRYTVRRQ